MKQYVWKPTALALFTLLLATACSSTIPKPDARETEAAAETAEAKPAAPSLSTAPVEDDGRSVLVVFGDSISAGYGLDPGYSYPDVLQQKINEAKLPWRVVNLGISGDTTAGGAARIESATSLHPKLVLLELGGNDGLRGFPLTATRENLQKMIVAFQNAGAKVVLAGMTLPPNFGPDYIQGFEAAYRDLAKQYKLTLIPFLLADMITPDLRYFQRDGIHPTADGAIIVAGTVYKTLEPILAAAK